MKNLLLVATGAGNYFHLRHQYPRYPPAQPAAVCPLRRLCQRPLGWLWMDPIWRLTVDEGISLLGLLPDGKTIAFSAQYDGNADVFIIPPQAVSPVHTASR